MKRRRASSIFARFLGSLANCWAFVVTWRITCCPLGLLANWASLSNMDATSASSRTGAAVSRPVTG